MQEELAEQSHGKIYIQKVNTILSYGFLKNRVLELLWKEAPVERIFEELENLFLKNTIPIRENRNNKREVGKYRARIRLFVL